MAANPTARDPRSEPAVDPARYLLAERWNNQLWYAAEPASVGSEPPVPLDAHVPQWRQQIADQADREPSRAGVDAVVISQARAEVLAALLRELSTRLRPGLAVGPIQSDGSLRDLLDELFDDLLTRC
jgi:hypothetical protein